MNAGDLITDGTAVFRVGDIKQDATKEDLNALTTAVSNLTNTVNSLFPKHEFTKNLVFTANTWTDVGIRGADLPTGTYILTFYHKSQVSSLWSERWSGVITWFNGGTNSQNACNIILHNSGHADNSNVIQARTIRESTGGFLRLQIHSALAVASCDWQFIFRRII